jgi:hypothetical protein
MPRQIHSSEQRQEKSLGALEMVEAKFEIRISKFETNPKSE